MNFSYPSNKTKFLALCLRIRYQCAFGKRFLKHASDHKSEIGEQITNILRTNGESLYFLSSTLIN